MSENAIPRSPKPRIESLSDLIFGLALSVGAIALLSTPPDNLGQILGDIIAFSFSFFIIARARAYYFNTHRMMRSYATDAYL